MGRRVLVIVAWLSVLGFAVAGPHSGAGGGGGGTLYPASASPSDHFIYMNDAGAYDLATSGGARATYNWIDGHGYTDALTFYGQMSLPLNGGGPYVNAYVYEGTSNGNTWWLAFGIQPFDTNCTGENVYPLWYSFITPSNPNVFTRWITSTGTKRVKILP